YRLLSFFAGVNHYRNSGPTDELPLSGNSAATKDRELADRETEQKRTHLKESIAALEDRFRREFPRGEKDATDSGGGNAKSPPEFNLAKLMQSDGERVLGKAEFARYQHLQD